MSLSTRRLLWPSVSLVCLSCDSQRCGATWLRPHGSSALAFAQLLDDQKASPLICDWWAPTPLCRLER